MSAFHPKVFIRADGLKRIANVHLIALLEPWRDYFASRGFSFPSDPDEDFPHDDLAQLLLGYDPEMPIDLMNGLYYIDAVASDESAENLLEIAEWEGVAIAIDGEATAADIAVQIYLVRPDILEVRMIKAIAFNKTAFQYYPGQAGEGSGLPEVTDEALAQMTEVMNPWFEKKKKGGDIRIFLFHQEEKFWLVIRHGKTMVREGKHGIDGEADVAFYRPQKLDVVIYDAARDLLGVNAETKGEKELYRQTLGDVVFGDALYFGDGNVFTLAPIRDIGPDVLNCDDIDGVTRVRLLEIVRVIPGEVSWIDKKSSSDLYRALGTRWQETLQRGRITAAKFGFLFEDSSRERSVHIRLDSARYDMDSDAERIEAWLLERGFFNIEREVSMNDANAPAMASA